MPASILAGAWHMALRFFNGFQVASRQIQLALHRPETFVLLPALTLAAFWLGGERALILAALGMPLLFAISSTFWRAELLAQTPEVLGGLSLRSQFIETLDATLRETHLTGRTTACLVLQIDQPERLTAQYGRAVLSEVLARSAERLCVALREGDSVARLEGGGFAVCLAPARRLDIEIVVQLAARLQAAIAVPVSINASRVYLSCSVGICLGARAPEPAGSSLFNAGQIAADEAQRHGPNAIRVFDEAMARSRVDRDCLRDDLETAINEGQIRAHFQPQVSTQSGAITGFEALARWYHPDKGVIAPSEFLPLIEASGLSERLGEVMLYNALTALVRWDKAGFQIPTVAVNFSGHELRNPKLAERLKWDLDRFGLAPQRLTVEVLEDVVAETENDVVANNIAAMAQMGCGIDLDDFGTGHASITSIRRFALRRLKIDRSFVSCLDTDREQQKMVAAILSMAQQLGLKTLAEGVETPGERAMLAQLGCGDVQGFGIARPMPVDETMGWISRNGIKAVASAHLKTLVSGG